MDPLTIQLKRNEYKNADAANKLIRYITRTRPNEDRADELLLWGTNHGYFYQKPVEEVIRSFEFIQNGYSVKNSLMCHYSIQIPEIEFERMGRNIYTIGNYAVECCQYIFSLGFQVCFAVHYSKEDKLHVHLAINTVNYKTGCKLRQYPKEIARTIEYPLKEIFKKYTYITTNFPCYY